jgi:hypothetical protein
VRVAMLVASIEGSIGMVGALGPVAELANPVNRPGKWPWGADQAQQPHGVVVWASADPIDGSNRNQPCQLTPGPARVALCCLVGTIALLARRHQPVLGDVECLTVPFPDPKRLPTPGLSGEGT